MLGGDVVLFRWIVRNMKEARGTFWRLALPLHQGSLWKKPRWGVAGLPSETRDAAEIVKTGPPLRYWRRLPEQSHSHGSLQLEAKQPSETYHFDPRRMIPQKMPERPSSPSGIMHNRFFSWKRKDCLRGRRRIRCSENTARSCTLVKPPRRMYT